MIDPEDYYLLPAGVLNNDLPALLALVDEQKQQLDNAMKLLKVINEELNPFANDRPALEPPAYIYLTETHARQLAKQIMHFLDEGPYQ